MQVKSAGQHNINYNTKSKRRLSDLEMLECRYNQLNRYHTIQVHICNLVSLLIRIITTQPPLRSYRYLKGIHYATIKVYVISKYTDIRKKQCTVFQGLKVGYYMRWKSCKKNQTRITNAGRAYSDACMPNWHPRYRTYCLGTIILGMLQAARVRVSHTFSERYNFFLLLKLRVIYQLFITNCKISST